MYCSNSTKRGKQLQPCVSASRSTFKDEFLIRLGLEYTIKCVAICVTVGHQAEMSICFGQQSCLATTCLLP